MQTKGNIVSVIELNQPLDMHVHFRDGKMLKKVVPCTSKYFSGAVVMPNVMLHNGEPWLVKPAAILEYKEMIEAAVVGDELFVPFMTAFLQTNMSKEILEGLKNYIIAAKLYPRGITTHSDRGVDLFDQKLGDVLGYLEELEIPLCVHPETSGFVMDRESEFCSFIRAWHNHYPRLKIIVEHITTKNMIGLVENLDNVYGTITAHHLLITLDDVVGGSLQPHLFCKPIAKKPSDRAALLQAALLSPKFMLGTDSAPHPRSKKECSGCAAGVFTAPIALPLLAELFCSKVAFGEAKVALQAFVSDRAKKIYNLPELPPKVTVLKQQSWKIPKTYYHKGDHDIKNNPLTPMWAGKELSWKPTAFHEEVV